MTGDTLSSDGNDGQPFVQLAELFGMLASAPLSPFLSFHYGLTSTDAPVDEVLLPESPNVRFVLSGEWEWQPVGGAPVAIGPASLFGCTSRGARIRAGAGAKMFGFGLRPLGWQRLCAKPGRLTADRMVALAEFCAPLAELHPALVAAPDMPARVALLEAAMMARIDDAWTPPLLLPELTRLLASPDVTSTADMAERLGVSLRTLERSCLLFFGFGPKRLLRRQRFLRTIDSMLRAPEQPLGTLIMGDYVDQSHFIREFRSFMGLSPTEYLALPRVVMRQAARARWQLQGQSVPPQAPR